MGEFTISNLSTEELLRTQSAMLKQWFDDNPAVIGGLQVRKFPATIEPVSFTAAGGEQRFDRGRFRVMLSNRREVWQVTMDLVFHMKARLLPDGTMLSPGVLMCAVDDEEHIHPVEYFDIANPSLYQGYSTEQWVHYWFKRMSKSEHLHLIFACKVFVEECEE